MFIANDQVCEPKSQFKEYCNSCVCSADGSNYACTKKVCDQNILNKDGTQGSLSLRTAQPFL